MLIFAQHVGTRELHKNYVDFVLCMLHGPDGISKCLFICNEQTSEVMWVILGMVIGPVLAVHWLHGISRPACLRQSLLHQSLKMRHRNV